MRRIKVIAILGLLLSVALVSGCQKGLFGDVEGVVVDVDRGEPVSGVDVRLDKINFSAKTDAAGIFRLKRVPVGVYALICSKSNGYFRETTIPNFRVKTDSVMRPTVALEVKPSLIFEDRKEPVALSSLKGDCLLFKGRYGLTNDPHQPLTNLVLVRGEDKKLLSKFGGLQGCVVVGTTDQALELARLFTDLKTFFYFRDVSPDNTFIEVRSTDGKPGLGELDRARAKKLGIVDPVVANDGSDFLITRYVMSMAHNLYRIKEQVGFDGQYAIVEKTLIIPKMDILVPAA